MANTSYDYSPIDARPTIDSDVTALERDIEKQQLLCDGSTNDYSAAAVAAACISGRHADEVTPDVSLSEEAPPPPIIVEIPEFVPSWEGIRGIAVLMVYVAHISTWSTPFQVVCGKGGVTIFFILSGFLITGILQRQQVKKQRVGERIHYRHILRFYADRSIRLYPALVMMTIVTTLLQLYIKGSLHPHVAAHAAASLLYVNNVVRFVMERGNIWGNTWSLAVEEQFYLCWSLLLPLLLMLSRHTRSAVIFGLCLASWLICTGEQSEVLEWSWWFMNSGPLFNFWKMLIGAFLRLSPGYIPKRFRHPATAWFGLALLVTIGIWHLPNEPLTLASIGLDKKIFRWEVWENFFISIAAVCMLLGSIDRGNAILDSRFLRFTGRISYALYLYQIPLLFLEDSSDKYAKGYDGFLRTCFAYIMGMLSTIFFEEPLRTRYRKWRGKSALPH